MDDVLPVEIGPALVEALVVSIGAIDGVALIDGRIVEALAELIISQNREALGETALHGELKCVERRVAHRFYISQATDAWTVRAPLIGRRGSHAGRVDGLIQFTNGNQAR